MDGFFDIIVFALIAGALFWRLRGALGETRDDQPPPFARNPFTATETETADPTETIGDGATAPNNLVQNSWGDRLPDYNLVGSATAHNQLTPLFAISPSFRVDAFLEKAKKAFAMIVTAYATGDRKTLEFLLAPNLYNSFIAEIERRNAAQETYLVAQNNLQKTVISSARLDGTIATVTVDFTAQQTVTHKDANGRTLEHDTNGKPHTTTDRWSFQKDLRDPGPLWQLIKTVDMDD